MTRADPGQRAVGREQHARRRRWPRRRSPARPPRSPAASRSTEPRSSAGIASTGSASTTANTSRLTAVSADTVAAGGKPGLHEHPVLQRRAQRAAAGRDLRQRVARQLGVITGPPVRAPAARRAAAPTGRRASELQRGHRRQRAGREARDVAPGAEHLEDRREHEVQRDAGDGEPEDRRGRGCAASRARSRRRRRCAARSHARAGRRASQLGRSEGVSVDGEGVDHHPVEGEDDDRPDRIGADRQQGDHGVYRRQCDAQERSDEAAAEDQERGHELDGADHEEDRAPHRQVAEQQLVDAEVVVLGQRRDAVDDVEHAEDQEHDSRRMRPSLTAVVARRGKRSWRKVTRPG